MGKAPAFQFYPGDWFREPGLKCVNLNVRGAWAELLMIMWDCTPQGKKESTLEGFARLWRTSLQEAAFIICELDREKVADVKYFDEECEKIIHEFSDFHMSLSPKCPDLSPDCPIYVTIINRRMFRNWNSKEYDRLKKQRQRDKKACQGDVPEKSLLYSSSSSSFTPIVPTNGDGDLFEIFWKNYPKKIGKGAAQKAWKKIREPTKVIELMKLVLPRQKISEQWTKENGQYIPNPATYLNQRRWEDETIQ